MAQILVHHTYSIENSSLNSISFALSNGRLVIHIQSTDMERLTGIKDALRALQIEQITDNTELQVFIQTNTLTETIAHSIHAILDEFSDHFGNNENLSQSILYTLCQQGINLTRSTTNSTSDGLPDSVTDIFTQLLLSNSILTEQTLNTLMQTLRVEPPSLDRETILSVLTEFSEQQETLTQDQTQTAPKMPDIGANAEKLADKPDIDIPDEYCCPLSLFVMTKPVYIPGDLAEGYDLELMSSLEDGVQNAKESKVYLDETSRTYFVKGMKSAKSLPEGMDLTNITEKLKNTDFKRSILAITSKEGHTPKEQRFEQDWLVKCLRETGVHPLNRGKFSIDNIVSDTELEEEIKVFVDRAETPSIAPK